jgi:hypothetical protein
MLNGNSSRAYGINDAGQEVGESGGRAYTTGPDGTTMMYLNSLIDPPDGIILTSAGGINNNE